MKKFSVVALVFIALFAIPAYIGWRSLVRHTASDKPAAQKYYCPMHPTYITDHPGDCPICNMRLIPMPSQSEETKAVSAEEHATMTEGAQGAPAGYSKIVLDHRTQELLNIEVAVVGPRSFTRSIHTAGRVASIRKQVDAELHRDDLLVVFRGKPVSIGLPSGERVGGTIEWIDQVPKALMQTVAMKIQAADWTHMKPRMVVDIMIDLDIGKGLAVPDEAVLPKEGGHIVFVAKGSGVYEPREITIGPVSDGHYRVEKGLIEGEKVVTNAVFLLDSESRLKKALQSSEGEAAHVHGQ